jgi:hypothetical protein
MAGQSAHAIIDPWLLSNSKRTLMNPLPESHPDSAAAAVSSSDIQPQPSKEGQARGIFLHTGWRSAGTWIWSRFRALPSVTAFYEPLHPMLGDLGLADIPAVQPTWTSGHPPLKAPYYDEYRPFMQERGRGVAGYRKSFATDRFGSVPDREFPALQGYLKNLRDHAIEQGKVPVLKFCRSSGRLPWLKSAFPDALHAVVLRNPASQFASGWLLHQQWSNAFFVAAPFRVLGLNQAEPLVRQVIELCGVQLPPGAPGSVEDYAALCEQYVRTVEGINAYRAFLALWTLAAVRMIDDVDLVIDVDRLGQVPAYAPELRAQIRLHTDAIPAFNGAKDLVGETRQSATRIKGIDGRMTRSVHFAVDKFVLSRRGSPDARAAVVESIREKLTLATELAEQWRY